MKYDKARGGKEKEQRGKEQELQKDVSPPVARFAAGTDREALQKYVYFLSFFPMRDLAFLSILAVKSCAGKEERKKEKKEG